MSTKVVGLTEVLKSADESLNLSAFDEWIARSSAPDSILIRRAVGSSISFVIRRLILTTSEQVVVIAPNSDRAAQIVSDLNTLGVDNVREFRSSTHHPYDTEQVVDSSAFTDRLDVLSQIDGGEVFPVVTSPEALYELVPDRTLIDDRSITVTPGGSITRDTLVEWLGETDFSRVDYVTEAGEAAIRGGIVDVFPFTGDYPIRIEFFGDEADTIREFDVETQRSISSLTSCRLVPGIDLLYHDMSSHRSFLDAVDPSKSTIVLIDEHITISNTAALYQSSEEAFQHFVDKHPDRSVQLPELLFQSGNDLTTTLALFRRVLAGSFSGSFGDSELDLGCSPQPDFNSSIQLLRAHIAESTKSTNILCDGKGQVQRLNDLLESAVASGSVRILVGSLHEGFVVDNSGFSLFTDHQIFNRFHRPSVRKRRASGGLSMRALKDLSVGDFVVHVDYGVGTFDGLKKITVRGKEQEAAKILYKDRDSLFVNVNAIHKLHKYSGKDGHQPTLTKLGTGQWERKKARTKKRVKDIARDLIKLYAKRRAAQGHAYPPDTVWQQELEASFQYEDTPDQSKAIDLVKDDMMQPAPMDRLVCGDVGFGKTEVAVRAAFKAVQDGRQAAVLVPTTILAEQHLDTFSKRLNQFPVRIAALSRFRDPAEQKQIIKDTATGKIDILIGTHRITSKDVVFNDLGLLIIDEEQRFGVSAKEKLRKLKISVDTLTLTATPIPRTLQFSLLGARDLSIISTPPPNRQPIATEIHTFDSELIRDAIVYELNRGGQVFFIHNRVKSIEEIASKLRDSIPDVRLRIAHGQMPPRMLENVMIDFKSNKFDVLVSTNIIENGLDISNANTIIINHANRFGLAELHQLRGRVGRSDRKAFCYLLVSSIHSLTREARQRLQALEEFSNLGAGFGLAMRDMDIRGAGNMLGAEQSGFIADVGFETYHKILDEAVAELRQDEFKELFKDQPAPALFETNVDVDVDALIPATYLSSSNERLNLYRRIAEAKDAAALHAIASEMEDRFGALIEPIDNLFIASRLKLIGQALHFQRITYKNDRLFLTFPDQSDSSYFTSTLFRPIMEWLTEYDGRFVMKESNRGTMRAIIQDVQSLQNAMTLCDQLHESVSLRVAVHQS